MSQSKPSKASVQEQIKKYDGFINDRLRVDLQDTLDQRDALYDKISEYLKLKVQIETIKAQGAQQLKTQVDIGCDFYVQAKVPDASRIFVDIGYGFYPELTLDEAIAFIDRYEKFMLRRADKLTEQAAQIKAHIKLVLEAIQEVAAAAGELSYKPDFFEP
ncbi:UXT-like protein [Polychytrium aggregatum]|uniref:UXT-like protein n=1 Tax=Polychytrium aggregatum TaxID=110093 RepID=UPI0022FE1332|nr:UXT-like protein [Polychytrium aggregatum]KAI9199702.1 UXT-like protein [Polychytrium aggregatum]